MRFRLRQMEVFRAVMLTGSMSGAARLLLVSQPSVSRLIAYTEQSLGLTLFQRKRGALVPTAEAERLFREVERLYETARQVDAFASDLRLRPQGVLSIAASPSLALEFVPAVLKTFRDQYPDIRVKLRTTLLADMARDLLTRQVSVAVSVMPISDPGVRAEPFATGRMVCIAPAGHPIATREVLGLAELAAYPMVLYDSGIPFGALISTAFERAGVRPQVAIEIARAELAFALVRKGLGLAIVDEFSVAAAGPADLVVRPLAERIPVSLALLRSAYARPSLPAQSFAKLVKTQAAMRGLGLVERKT